MQPGVAVVRASRFYPLTNDSSDMPEATPYLRIRALTKKFGDFKALKNVALDVNRGELVCLLGPSGCGKTTVLRCIAGLETPTSGKIVQNGIDIAPLPPDQRDFGIVFQSYALFPNLTVDENLAFGLHNRKMPRSAISERVGELTETVGLEGHGNKFPGQLSGGQQQRVALARALAPSPSLLLLDEPLSALDAKVRQHLRREILDLQRKIGITTILVTHDQEEALTMGDRIVVMDHGVIAQTGRPQEIYERPDSPFVADFIGEMNFLKGTLQGDNLVAVGQLKFTFEQPEDSPPQGKQVLVCIRPEDIVLSNDSEKLSGPNSVCATVRDCEFLGSVYRVRMTFDTQNNTEFVAQVSPSRMRSLRLQSDTQIQVQFPVDRVRVYHCNS